MTLPVSDLIRVVSGVIPSVARVAAPDKGVPSNVLRSAIDGQPLRSAINGQYLTSARSN